MANVKNAEKKLKKRDCWLIPKQDYALNAIKQVKYQRLNIKYQKYRLKIKNMDLSRSDTP